MNRISQPSRPHRVARQRRSQLTIEAIREAAALVLREQGVEALTTNRVAERAGVGIASLYRYYPDKEAILSDLFEQQLQRIDRRLREKAQEVQSGESMAALIRQGIVIAMDYSAELTDLHRDFFQAHRQSFDITARLAPQGEGTWDLWAQQWFSELLRSNSDSLRVSDLSVAARFVVDVCTGYIHRLVETRPEDLSDSRQVDALADMVCRYLLKADGVSPPIQECEKTHG